MLKPQILIELWKFLLMEDTVFSVSIKCLESEEAQKLLEATSRNENFVCIVNGMSRHFNWIIQTAKRKTGREQLFQKVMGRPKTLELCLIHLSLYTLPVLEHV
ncbi:hypothetical protein ATANTOWER_002552 [Ataeniobius toweri]|uniref:LAGLIDADG homing endonuclease n=1 Tax=Ataeniobius toweri TaxID=208326 RepID=A0ABU7C729_9TELE|nr:hypothetical protein [Ataeniobius toweri]